jgi:hypothetical protein
MCDIDVAQEAIMKMRIYLLILLVATLGLTASAQEVKIHEGPPVYSMTRMRITLVTGGDDLRYDSRVSAFIITRSGRRVQSPPLNCVRVNRNASGGWDASGCSRIPNGTRRTFVWNFNNIEHARPEDVHRFGLAFESGNTGPFDTGDNWDLDRLEVEYFVGAWGSKSGRAEPTQLLRSQAPLYRFKSREEWESNPLGRSESIGIRPVGGRRP